MLKSHINILPSGPRTLYFSLQRRQIKASTNSSGPVSLHHSKLTSSKCCSSLLGKSVLCQAPSNLQGWALHSVFQGQRRWQNSVELSLRILCLVLSVVPSLSYPQKLNSCDTLGLVSGTKNIILGGSYEKITFSGWKVFSCSQGF